MLQVNRTLTKLDISSNRVDWDCAPYLARALATNRSLEVLEVSSLTQALKGTRGEQSSRALSIGVSFNHMLLECPITTELFTKNRYDFNACNNVRDFFFFFLTEVM